MKDKGQLACFEKKIPVAVINSYDGANHYTNNTGDRILTYSTQLFSRSMQNFTSTSKSSNILTFMQVKGNETMKNIVPVLTTIYEDIQKVRR